jgi:hypothetical protein
MRHIFVSIIFFILLPFSVFGEEWTIKYEMIHPDGKVKFVTVSIPNESGWKIPYLAGMWECWTNRSEISASFRHYYTSVFLTCVMKEIENVRVSTIIGCDNNSIKDSRKNSLKLALSGEVGSSTNGLQLITLECKLR